MLTPKRSVVLLVVVGCLAFSCASGQTTKLNAAPTAPAAVGDVKTSQGDNGNTVVKVQVEYLAPPAKISHGASVYVVWAKPPTSEAPQNIGVLQVDESRKGMLATKTPLRTFDVLITAESSASVSQPSGAPVMTASIVAN